MAAGKPVSLAAPGAFLLGAGLVGPAVFFLPHPLGEDAQGEVTRRGPARFCGKSAQVVVEGNQVRFQFRLS